MIRAFTFLSLTFLSGFMVVFLDACAPLERAAPPVSSLTLPANTDLTKLERGRELYARSCTQCHGPARIDRHGSDEKWAQTILPKMCEKAKLGPADSAALTSYVITARKSFGKPPQAPNSP